MRACLAITFFVVGSALFFLGLMAEPNNQMIFTSIGGALMVSSQWISEKLS